MTHDKPKVTIDLAEYNELINFRNNEVNLFYLAITNFGQLVSEKYPELTINEINKYLREKANIELVRTSTGFIKIIKIC